MGKVLKRQCRIESAHLLFPGGECPACRRRGTWVNISCSSIICWSLGFFVVFPLISIRFVDQMAGPPSWSVLPSVYASLFSKVWYFRRRNCRPLWCQTDDCHRYADACRRIRHNGYRPRTVATVVFMPAFGLGTLFDPPRSALVVKLIRPQQRGRFSR